MFLMILVLIMMIIITIGSSGIAGGGVYCVEDGYRWNQNCGGD
jgi:hypothetical protein